MANSFKNPVSFDHEIVDGDGKIIGQIRIKPNRIMWSPKGKHSWFGVSLDKFAEFIVKEGTEQKK